MKLYKKVLIPIEVPSSNFCLENNIRCYYLDQHPSGTRCDLRLRCDLGFDITSELYEKPYECLCLEELKPI